MDKEQIIQIIEKNKKSIRKLSVRKIGVFGSFVKNKQKANSDIDLLVEFNVTNADNYFELLYLLEKLFKKTKIDLIIESGLKPEVEYIKEEAEYVKI
jgi:uncharacterized protein